MTPDFVWIALPWVIVLFPLVRDLGRAARRLRARRQAQARGLTVRVSDWAEIAALGQLEAPVYAGREGIFTTPESAAQARVLADCRSSPALTEREFMEVSKLVFGAW